MWYDTQPALNPAPAGLYRRRQREGEPLMPTIRFDFDASPRAIDPAEPNVYRYRLAQTGFGSARYGPCEVCDRHCDTVYHQVEERRFRLHPDEQAERGEEFGWTQYQCHNLFGHQSCLLAARRGGGDETTGSEVPL